MTFVVNNSNDAPGGPATPAPAIVTHYAAYLRAKTKLTPEVETKDARATLTIECGESLLTLVFSRRKRRWLLSGIEVHRGDQKTSFTQGELGRAIAALLNREPMPPNRPVISGASGPRTDAALRERRT